MNERLQIMMQDKSNRFNFEILQYSYLEYFAKQIKVECRSCSYANSQMPKTTNIFLVANISRNKSNLWLCFDEGAITVQCKLAISKKLFVIKSFYIICSLHSNQSPNIYCCPFHENAKCSLNPTSNIQFCGKFYAQQILNKSKYFCYKR